MPVAFLFLSALVPALSVCTGELAQEDSSAEDIEGLGEVTEDTAPEEASPWSFDAWAFGRTYGTVDFEDSGGDVGTHRLGLSAAVTRRLSESDSLRLGISAEQSFYDFDDVPFVLDDDPFDALLRTGLYGTYSRQENRKLRWSASLYANAGGEPGAQLSDALTFGVGGQAHYRFSESFALSLGLYGTTRLEDDFVVYPVSAIDWKITERLHLGEEGSGVGLGWRLHDDLRTYGNLAFAVRQFRLDEPELAGDFDGGVFRDDELALNVGVVWSPGVKTRVELFGGAAIRELTFLDDGGSGFQEDLETGPYVGLSVRLTP